MLTISLNFKLKDNWSIYGYDFKYSWGYKR